jgi:hypothetical protein
MEEFLNQTRGFLGVIQSIMTPEEREHSAKVAEQMYEAIREVTKDTNLNVREMLNASLAVQATILELTLEQMEDRRNNGE